MPGFKACQAWCLLTPSCTGFEYSAASRRSCRLLGGTSVAGEPAAPLHPTAARCFWVGFDPAASLPPPPAPPPQCITALHRPVLLRAHHGVRFASRSGRLLRLSDRKYTVAQCGLLCAAMGGAGPAKAGRCSAFSLSAHRGRCHLLANGTALGSGFRLFTSYTVERQYQTATECTAAALAGSTLGEPATQPTIIGASVSLPLGGSTTGSRSGTETSSTGTATATEVSTTAMTSTSVTPPVTSSATPSSPTFATSSTTSSATLSTGTVTKLVQRNQSCTNAPAGVVWAVSLPSLPKELGEVAAGMIDGIIYVAGQGSSSTFGFSVATATWAVLPARPYAGDHHAAVTLGGELWLVGGFNGGSAGKVQVFDPAAGRWRVAPPVPYGDVGSVSAVAIGLHLIVCGGLSQSRRQNLRNCSRYAPGDAGATGTWSTLAPMLLGVNHQASGTDGKRLYVFGGRRTRVNMPGNGVPMVQIYSPSTDSWEFGPPSPLARSGMGHAPFLGSKFYVIGGEEKRSGAGFSNAKGVFDQVHSFHPPSGSWATETPMPVAVHGIYPVALPERRQIYVVGGGVKAGYSKSALVQTLRLPEPTLGGCM